MTFAATRRDDDVALAQHVPPPHVDDSLASARAQTLATLGQLEERPLVASRGTLPHELLPWPARPVGRIRFVRRQQTALLVTDGLSDPWDPALHASVPGFRFGCELALEVPLGPNGAPPQWASALLLWISDWLVEKRFDLRARLKAHTCLTLGALPQTGLDAWRAPNGLHGLLLGLPFVGDNLGAHAVLARTSPVEAVWLVPMKLLHPLEYAWALEVRDASRATWLAQVFMQADRHISRTDRPAVVGQPG